MDGEDVVFSTEPNVVSFSAMIDACAKAGSLEKAEKWHARMVEVGVEPNSHSFGAVINACAKSGEIQSAIRWLDRMEDCGIVADVVIYSTMLDAAAKVNDTDQALDVFRRMKSKGVRPNVISYAALARPFAHRGNYRQVEKLLQDMRADGLVMNEYFLYVMLVAYASARPRQSQRAEDTFCDAVTAGVEINDHVHNGLVRAVGRARATELAQELTITTVPRNLRRPAPSNRGQTRS